MTDKEKIRAEIERLKEWQPIASPSLNKLLSFIDSLQEEPKKCVYTKDHYTDEDRRVLCDGCEEECKYAQKEEPVSEELEEASKEWLRPQLDKSYVNYGEVKMMELTHFDGYAMLDAIEFGAKWQKTKDQSTIELAEDHAMFAGMEKMKEEMVTK